MDDWTIVATDQYLRLAELDWVSTMFVVTGPFAVRARVVVEIQENRAPINYQPAVVVDAPVRPLGFAPETFTVSFDQFDGVAVPFRAHLINDYSGELKASSAWVVTLLSTSVEARTAGIESFF
jgi:hypothetical protein